MEIIRKVIVTNVVLNIHEKMYDEMCDDVANQVWNETNGDGKVYTIIDAVQLPLSWKMLAPFL